MYSSQYPPISENVDALILSSYSSFPPPSYSNAIKSSNITIMVLMMIIMIQTMKAVELTRYVAIGFTPMKATAKRYQKVDSTFVLKIVSTSLSVILNTILPAIQCWLKVQRRTSMKILSNRVNTEGSNETSNFFICFWSCDQPVFTDHF